MVVLRPPRDWVVDRARRDIRDALKSTQSTTVLLDRIGALPGWTRLKLIIFGHVFLLGCAVALKGSRIRLLEFLAPGDAVGTLHTLWQVQAALVALAFPFLLLLVQFAQDDEVAALGTSEVLARASFIRPAMEFATVGLASVSVLSAWLASHPALVLGIVLIELPTLGLLIWCYSRALELLFDRPLLQRRSAELLEEKLTSSMEELWALHRANQLLLEGLREVGIEHAYVGPDEFDDRWWSVSVDDTGRISDIDRRGVAQMIQGLPRKGVSAGADPKEPNSESPDAQKEESVGRIYKLCGDTVVAGDTVMLLRRSAFSIAAQPRLSLGGALRVERFDD